MTTIREAHRRRVVQLETAASTMMLDALGGILATIAGTFAAVIAAAEDQASLDDLAAINAQWRAVVQTEITPWFAAVYKAGADAAEDQTRALGAIVTTVDPALVDEAAAWYLASTSDRFYKLGDTAWTAAQAELVEGFRAGEGIDKLRRRITSVTDLTRAQAESMARTEVISASNMGAAARVELMGDNAPPYKQWLATDDSRTRPTHRHADGQVVPRGTPFEVGDSQLKVPGDPAGPPAEVINCRCTWLAVDTAEGISVDVPGRGQGGMTDEMSAIAAAAAVPGPDQVDTMTGEPHDGAMIALVPSTPAAWTIPDGEPADAVHLTLAYLGDAADIPPQVFDELTAGLGVLADYLDPVEGRVFGSAVWNTTGDTPSLVLSIGGDMLGPIHEAAWYVIREAAAPQGRTDDVASPPLEGGWSWPVNHTPWVAHLCLAYTPTPDQIEAARAMEGPITFDTLRVTSGAQAFDFPLGQPVAQEADMNRAEIIAAVDRAAAAYQPAGFPPVVMRVPAELMNDMEILGLRPVTAAAAAEAPPFEPGEHLRAAMHLQGATTGDRETGRLFMNTTYREAPFSFNWQIQSSAHGGTPVVVHVGNVVRVVEGTDGQPDYGFVQLDLDSKDGAEYGRRAAAGVERWVSIGLDETMATVTIQWPDDPPAMNDDGLPTEVLQPVLQTFDGGRVCELTGTSVPAQAEAEIEPSPELLARYADPSPGRALARGGIVAAAPAAADCGCGGACGACGGAGHDVTPPSTADRVQAITAASMTITLRELPPAAWFEEPTDVPMAGALMINDQGRIWGMLAPLGTNHRLYAQSGQRLTAPVGNVDYSRFMGGWAPTDAGLVAAGPLTMDCGHAPTLRTNHDVALEHYDNSCSVFGHIAVGERADGRGAWMAGALLPGTRPDQVARALACRCSGDWQPHPDRSGWQELVACLLVPVPGFGSSHPSTTYQGDALVASSVPVQWFEPTAAGTASARARAAGVVALADAAGRSPAARVRALLGE